MTEYQLKGKIILTGNMVVTTGLVIGGSKTALEIGGMDNPVIKDSKGVPYVPGSSLKGKIRSLLEQSTYPLRNEDKDDGKGYFNEKLIIHVFKDGKTDDIIKIFGAPDVEEPGRGIFRDSFLDLNHFENNSETLFKNLELDFTEDKIENNVDRISARATPRHLERVPSGAVFAFELILDLFSKDDKGLLKTLFKGLKLLEDDYLGGSGSRGSGKVLFDAVKMVFRNIGFYETKEKETILREKFNLKDIVDDKWYDDVYSKINL